MKISPDQLDAWRVVPRVMVALYGVMIWKVTVWFMALPEPSSAQSMFVSTVVGASAGWFGLYVNSGKKRE